MKNRQGNEAIPSISSILKYLLISYKNRLLEMPCTPELSRVVSSIDYILETEGAGHE